MKNPSMMKKNFHRIIFLLIAGFLFCCGKKEIEKEKEFNFNAPAFPTVSDVSNGVLKGDSVLLDHQSGNFKLVFNDKNMKIQFHVPESYKDWVQLKKIGTGEDNVFEAVIAQNTMALPRTAEISFQNAISPDPTTNCVVKIAQKGDPDVLLPVSDGLNPLAYWAEYNLKEDGKFAETHKIEDMALYFPKDIVDSLITPAPKGYRVPSESDFSSIFPKVVVPIGSKKSDNYDSKRDETFKFNGEEVHYKAEYYRQGNKEEVMPVYGLKFIDEACEDLISLKYEALPRDEHKNYGLKITCRHLGAQYKGYTAKQIANDEFWNNNNAKDVVRLFYVNSSSIKNEAGGYDAYYEFMGLEKGEMEYAAQIVLITTGMSYLSGGFSVGELPYTASKLDKKADKHRYPIRCIRDDYRK